ncbi:CsbD family protein [Streptococcus fryi]
MSEEKLNATLEQVSGSAKEFAGKVLGDKSLEAEGTVEKAVGKAKELAEDAKGAVEGALKGIQNAFDKK